MLSVQGIFPTISELIIADPKNPTGTERRIITALKGHFSECIAPLLLLTEIDLKSIDGIGPTYRAILKQRLDNNGLRLRYMDEPVTYRAMELYGSMDKVPIYALCVTPTHAGFNTHSDFYRSPAINLLAMQRDTMTIGELMDMSKSDIRRFLMLSGLSLDDTRMRLHIEELSCRLRNWGLKFASVPNSTSPGSGAPVPGTIPISAPS